MFIDRNRPLVPINIEKLKPYVAGKTIEEVKKEFNPPAISKLASNENRLGCSPRIKDAVLEAMQEIQDYPDPASRVLKAQLAEHNGVDPGNIIVAAGSESVIAILCRTFFLNNEEAITADATFVGFFVQANVRGIRLKMLPVTDDYRYDLEAMAAAVTDQTKMIYIANPNNPTGTYITKSEFEWFMNRIPEDILVIMDEAYYEYAKDIEDYPHSLDYRLDNVITLRTFSKAYGLAGFRIGYGIGHEELIRNMSKTKLTFEPTTLAQAAASVALEDEKFLEESRKMVENGKKRMYRFFDEQDITYIPSVSNSVMIVLSSEQEAIDITQRMLENGVILRRVAAFGLPNCIRITVGTDKEIDHLIESFKNVRKRQAIKSD